MSPVAQSEGHDGPRRIDEFVPGCAAVIDQVLVGREHAIGQPVVAHELPHVFDRFSMMPLYAGFVQRSGVECDWV